MVEYIAITIKIVSNLAQVTKNVELFRQEKSSQGTGKL